MTRDEAQKQLKAMGITAQLQGDGQTVTGQIPTEGESIPGDSQMILYFGEVPGEEMVTIPDFTGMNRQQASDAAGQVGLYILVVGNDSLETNVTVTDQSQPAGSQVAKGTTIRLTFTDPRAAD